LERLCPWIGDGVMAVRDVVQAAAGVGGGWVSMLKMCSAPTYIQATGLHRLSPTVLTWMVRAGWFGLKVEAVAGNPMFF
jgi:hypothetical protein